MEPLDFDLKIYIPFFSDYGFKVTFGNEKNTLFLRQALQALIGSDVPIEEVRFDKNTLEGATAESRSGVLDLSCRNALGDIFIVEMQMSLFRSIIQRLRFYAHSKLDAHIEKGQYTFTKLPKVYCIGILSKSIYTDRDYHRIGQLRDEKGRVMASDDTYVILELDKFKKKPENCTSNLDKLIFIMKEAHNIAQGGQAAPPFAEEPWIAAALQELDTRGLSPDRRADLKIRLAYELSERYRQEHWEEEAVQFGFEKGMEKAIRNLMLAMPQETDETISKILQVPLALVIEVRKVLDKEKNN